MPNRREIWSLNKRSLPLLQLSSSNLPEGNQMADVAQTLEVELFIL